MIINISLSPYSVIFCTFPFLICFLIFFQCARVFPVTSQTCLAFSSEYVIPSNLSPHYPSSIFCAALLVVSSVIWCSSWKASLSPAVMKGGSDECCNLVRSYYLSELEIHSFRPSQLSESLLKTLLLYGFTSVCNLILLSCSFQYSFFVLYAQCNNFVM